MVGIYVKSFGCSANIAEGEMINGVLKEANHEVVQNPEEAEVLVLNICTVKGDEHALKEISETTKTYPQRKLVITGCIPKLLVPKLNSHFPGASLLSTHQLRQIGTAVEETIADTPVNILGWTEEPKLNLPRIRKNPVVGIINISSGCDSFCTFCSVKQVKGKHVSYPKEMIVNEVRQAVKEGCKELWLTGQDTSCYGTDTGMDLPTLLKEITQVEGDFFVRLGMGNPKHVRNYTKELIGAYKNKKMFKFLHAPVQSGDEDVLKSMKREHTAEDFRKIVEEFRKEFPQITISTDIIAGFPGETEEQFQNTVKLLKETKPDVINISRFAARPGTLAAKMENQLHGRQIKERSRELTQVYHEVALEKNKEWIGWQGKVVIDEHGQNQTSVGRNYAYKPVVVKGNYELGKEIEVKIKSATHFALYA